MGEKGESCCDQVDRALAADVSGDHILFQREMGKEWVMRMDD
jgi:hypothetical protein